MRTRSKNWFDFMEAETEYSRNDLLHLNPEFQEKLEIAQLDALFFCREERMGVSWLTAYDLSILFSKGRVSVCSSSLNPVVLYGLGFDHHLLVMLNFDHHQFLPNPLHNWHWSSFNQGTIVLMQKHVVITVNCVTNYVMKGTNFGFWILPSRYCIKFFDLN